jgi:serine/threonine-protein kinase
VFQAVSAGAQTVVMSSRTATNDRLFTPGQVVAARYRIVSCLGQGGMGEVYRADDLTLGHPVALKFLPPGFGDNPRWMERFRNEVRTARQVAHPNVCRVHDLGDVAGDAGAPLTFLTMEYIDGEDLASLLRRIGRLPHDKAVQVAHQLCSGLSAAHAAGVLHRDLKPANIMIDGRGNAKITDFGIAGLAGNIDGNDVRSGTPAYMAPEQLAGREVSLRSDIYSLGLVLYELFTGRRAFDAEATSTGSRTEADLSRPSTIVQDMDPAIERVILRCLNDDPAQRPATAMGVAAGLPGGDPLRAALEAGETPSPELVAAAGADQRIPHAFSVPVLAIALLAIVGCVIVSRFSGLVSFLPLPKTPDVLADRARDVIKALAPQLDAVDSASNLALKRAPLVAITRASDAPDRWDTLRTGRPVVLRYWMRTSPRRFAPIGQQGGVQQNDPAMDVPGMVMVELDTLGRLASFQAVPPWPESDDRPMPPAGGRGPGAKGTSPSLGIIASPAPPPAKPGLDSRASKSDTPFDWSEAFRLAELPLVAFRTADPSRVPPNYADARVAWEPVDPDGEYKNLRVEGALYDGHPISFRVATHVERPDAAPAADPPTAGRYFQYFLQSLIIAGVFFALWLARHNFRTGRGDRAGAWRLAFGFFFLGVVLWAINTHWAGNISAQWTAFVRGSGQPLVISGLAWVFYMALEPFVRRRQPQLIVSWTRLLSGRVHDPLVGRDVLLGVALGAVFTLFWISLPFLHQLVRGYLTFPTAFEPEILGGVLGGLAVINASILTAAVNAMLVFFLFIALDSSIPRRAGAAIFAVLCTGAFINDAGGGSIIVAVAAAAFVAVCLTITLARVGLLTFVVAIGVANTLLVAPFTTALGAWHARGLWVIFAAIGLLLAWSFASAAALGPSRRARTAPAR